MGLGSGTEHWHMYYLHGQHVLLMALGTWQQVEQCYSVLSASQQQSWGSDSCSQEEVGLMKAAGCVLPPLPLIEAAAAERHSPVIGLLIMSWGLVILRCHQLQELQIFILLYIHGLLHVQTTESCSRQSWLADNVVEAWKQLKLKNIKHAEPGD